MKIVIDARILRTSTGRYVERLLHYLQIIDSVNEYVVLLLKKDFDGWEPTSKNFKKEVSDYPIYSKRAQIGLARQLNGLKADVVHFPFQMVPVLYRRPYVVTIHDLTQLRFRNPGKTKTSVGYKLKQKQLALNFKIAGKNAKKIITPSKYVKSDFLKFLPKINPSKVVVIYEGADAALGSSDSHPLSPIKDLTYKDFILYVGTAHVHKNLKTLLKAFSLLKDQHPSLHLALAGKQDAIYKNFIENSHDITPSDTHYLGFVSDDQLAWLYKKAKAYAFPSFSEGFGLPGLEAMNMGAPVISSNATCLPEIYGDAALYFDPENPTQLADIVNRVLIESKVREELIKKGHRQVKRYSWHKMAEQTLQIYKDADTKNN